MKRILNFHDQIGTERWLIWIVLLLSALGLVFTVVTTAAVGSIRTVALSGQPAPGTPSGVTFRSFRVAYLDASGRTAFTALLTGSGVDNTNTDGVWSETSGSLKLVAREGDQAADVADGLVYAGFGTSSGLPVLNSRGQIANRLILVGDGINKTNAFGIWSEGSGSFHLVAREGNQVPGMPESVVFHRVGWPVFNAAGEIAFDGSLVGDGVNSSNDGGIWSEGSGNLELLAREGSHAPGTPDGVNFREVMFPLQINAAGETAFRALLAGDTVDATNNSGIWSGYAGNLRLVVRSGTPAPMTPSGTQFVFIDWIFDLNAAGRTAFVAAVKEGGVNGTSYTGVWSEGSGSLKLVARGGRHAPGTPDDVNFGRFQYGSLALNAAGQTSFGANLTGIGVNRC
jgi:hypothetical protein